jgi:hypothetical protein
MDMGESKASEPALRTRDANASETMDFIIAYRLLPISYFNEIND